jgi:hypothetical protein
MGNLGSHVVLFCNASQDNSWRILKRNWGTCWSKWDVTIRKGDRPYVFRECSVFCLNPKSEVRACHSKKPDIHFQVPLSCTLQLAIIQRRTSVVRMRIRAHKQWGSCVPSIPYSFARLFVLATGYDICFLIPSQVFRILNKAREYMYEVYWTIVEPMKHFHAALIKRLHIALLALISHITTDYNTWMPYNDVPACIIYTYTHATL